MYNRRFARKKVNKDLLPSNKEVLGGLIEEKTESKYKAKKTSYDGIVFDSKREAKRYEVLKGMLDREEIYDLKMQVPFELIPKQVNDSSLPKSKQRVLERKCEYLADFTYFDKEGKLHVEDTKGMRTPEYVIKRKLMLYTFGIKIEEI